MLLDALSKSIPVRNVSQQERERLTALAVPTNDKGRIPPLIVNEWNVSLMKVLVNLKKDAHYQRLFYVKRAANANAALVRTLIMHICLTCFISSLGSKELGAWFYAAVITILLAMSFRCMVSYITLENVEGRVKGLQQRDADLMAVTEKFKKKDDHGPVEVKELVQQMEIMYAVIMGPLFPDDFQPPRLWPVYLYVTLGFITSLLSMTEKGEAWLGYCFPTTGLYKVYLWFLYK